MGPGVDRGRRAHRPDLVVSAGFLKLVGRTFLDAFGDRYLNTHNALLPSFPGIHGPADALAYGVKVTGATLFFVDDGVDTGPILAQVAVPVEDDDTVETLTERIKTGRTATTRRAGATAGPAGAGASRAGRSSSHDGNGIRGQRHIDPAPDAEAEPSTGRRPLRRALVSVYDKTRLVELGTALHAAGVALVSTGSTARTLSEAGIPVTPVEQITGFAECLDGRVKTLHPAVHGGLLADTRRPEHLAQIAELGIEPFDLVVCNLYPVPGHRGLRRRHRRMRRADRHRRAVDDPGGREEPPERGRGGRARAATTRCSPPCAPTDWTKALIRGLL